MNKDNIIRMAREAGIDTWWESGDENRERLQDHLEHFAGLVATSEREACAKAIENSMDGFHSNSEWSDGYIQAVKDIADGIRAQDDT